MKVTSLVIMGLILSACGGKVRVSDGSQKTRAYEKSITSKSFQVNRNWIDTEQAILFEARTLQNTFEWNRGVDLIVSATYDMPPADRDRLKAAFSEFLDDLPIHLDVRIGFASGAFDDRYLYDKFCYSSEFGQPKVALGTPIQGMTPNQQLLSYFEVDKAVDKQPLRWSLASKENNTSSNLCFRDNVQTFFLLMNHEEEASHLDPTNGSVPADNDSLEILTEQLAKIGAHTYYITDNIKSSNFNNFMSQQVNTEYTSISGDFTSFMAQLRSEINAVEVDKFIAFEDSEEIILESLSGQVTIYSDKRPLEPEEYEIVEDLLGNKQIKIGVIEGLAGSEVVTTQFSYLRTEDVALQLVSQEYPNYVISYKLQVADTPCQEKELQFQVNETLSFDTLFTCLQQVGRFDDVKFQVNALAYEKDLVIDLDEIDPKLHRNSLRVFLVDEENTELEVDQAFSYEEQNLVFKNDPNLTSMEIKYFTKEDFIIETETICRDIKVMINNEEAKINTDYEYNTEDSKAQVELISLPVFAADVKVICTL